MSEYRLDFDSCRALLERRLREAAPSRIQLLTGPRQVGKTTLLLDLAKRLGDRATYVAGDAPEASLPGHWERIWATAERGLASGRSAVLLIDEIQHIHDWSKRLKGEWDRILRNRSPLHVVATGSSALRLGVGSRESLAGRFERLTLTHWSAANLAQAFKISPASAAEQSVRFGTYPGAFRLRKDPARWAAYVRDAILEPALTKDILHLADVRRPGLLRQVFAVAAGTPASILALQKIQGRLQDRGALDTIAHYLDVLEEAYLVAPLEKHATTTLRRRAAPPKIVVLNNALVTAMEMLSTGAFPDDDRLGMLVENACLAHAWNSGQRVTYWREEPLEVDGVIDGSWGKIALEVKTGRVDSSSVTGLFEFCRRHPAYRPLVLCDQKNLSAASRFGVAALDWREFLARGPSLEK